MVNHEYRKLYWDTHIDKQIKIISDDNSLTLTNSDINWENFELTESLCSEMLLQFGSCEASVLKFKISNTFIPLVGKWLTVTETLEKYIDIPFQFGKYKVFSDVPTADRRYRDIIAYDIMYDILNTDVTQWYNSVLPKKDSKIIMKQFREKFVRYFGLTEVVSKDGLVNDDMVVERTIDPEQISGKDVITAICEINGCFGHIGRDGKFHYIYLEQNIQGLYPSNTLFPEHAPDYLPQSKTSHLYPQDPKSTRLGNGVYISAKYDDYLCKSIDKIQIKQEENDIGCIYGEGDNTYTIVDNFLVYGKSSEELEKISKNIFDKITNLIYRPFSAECVGNPCLEVGDPVRLSTKYELIESYILERTLKGIQGIRDTYEATGEEYRSEQINSVQKSITQLKGKTNILTRNIEETKSEINAIDTNIKDNYSTTTEMRTEIKQTADNITLTVDKKIDETKEYADSQIQTTSTHLSSKIEQTAEQIKSTVAKENTKWDTTGYTIAISSYGSPSSFIDEKGNLIYKPEEYKNKYYLDQETGYLYQSIGYSWDRGEKLKLVTEVLNSSIEQTANSITSTVAAATSKYDIGNNRVDYYGYGAPGEDLEDAPDNFRYLDQSSGDYYVKWYYGWEKAKTFDLITNELSSKITQTADSITSEVKRATSAEGELSSKITQTADSITSEVKRATSAEGELSSKITQTADSITSEVKGTTDELSTKIEQTNSKFVLKAQSNGDIAQVELGKEADEATTKFLVKAGNIDLSANDVFNIMSGGTLNLTGKNIKIDSNNFNVDSEGNVWANNVNLSGTINASGGTIAGWNVTESGLSVGENLVSEGKLSIAKKTETETINFQAYPGYIALNPGSNGTISLNGTLSVGDGNIKFTQDDFSILSKMISQSGIKPD